MAKMFSEKIFDNYKVYEYDLCGRKLVVENGKMAGLANGSVLVRYGETVILCCATASATGRVFCSPEVISFRVMTLFAISSSPRKTT